MGDKARRNEDQRIRLSETQMRQPGMDDVAALKPDVPEASSGKTSELAEEYGYVLSDLSRIGIIAVVMLGVLVGLAFILA